MPNASPSSEPSEAASPDPAGTASAEPKNGRPSLYTPERAEQICAAIRGRGHTDTRAGLLAGVSSSTVSRWRQENEEFAFRLDQARAQYFDERLGEIQETRKRDGSCDWRAQAWLLQRACPEEYGPPSRRHRLARGTEQPEAPAGDPFAVNAEQLSQMQQRRQSSREENSAAPPAEEAIPAPGAAEGAASAEVSSLVNHVAHQVHCAQDRAPTSAPADAPVPSKNQPVKIVQSVPKPPAPLKKSSQSTALPPPAPTGTPASPAPAAPVAPPQPATLKPAPSATLTAAQRPAAAAAAAAKWQQIHAALEAQWERDTDRNAAAADDPSLASIPGMWAG